MNVAEARPAARLVPVEPDARGSAPRGRLEDDDPFFAIMENLEARRVRHPPRVLRATRRRARR